MNYNKYITVLLLMILLTAFGVSGISGVSAGAAGKVGGAGDEGDRKPGRLERKADRFFVRQDFDRAMSLYEEVLQSAESAGHQAELHLKAARLYFMLRDYPNAAEHYASAMAVDPLRLGVGDVCFYIDALRFQGKDRQAESIALDNAYKDIYSRYQRYQNTLDALSMRHRMLADDSYEMYRLSINSPQSDYWVGKFEDQPFYALSYSRFNNPNKLFFHRTKYFGLDETDEPLLKKERMRVRISEFFRNIPMDLQIGPVSFNSDISMMVATSVAYGRKERIIGDDGSFVPFQSKLVYSALNKRKTKYSRFKNLFYQEHGYSYGHPCLINEGKSILFTSNMPGGFGGYDLYIMNWNDDKQDWNNPINMGREINTEGDEIFPVLFNDNLIFSSNGHPGYGGYDLYGTYFDPANIGKSPIRHFSYPVNSEYNDTYILPLDTVSGYMVTDRNLRTQDDIYYYKIVELLVSETGGPFFGLPEEDALRGGETIIREATEAGIVTQQVELFPNVFALTSLRVPEHEKRLLITVYFDFDMSTITVETAGSLDVFLKNTDFSKIEGLEIVGSADEMGGEQYNYRLSEKRAKRVADYLTAKGLPEMPMTREGRGRVWLTPPELEFELEVRELGEVPDNREQKISINRRARRVEIYKTND